MHKILLFLFLLLASPAAYAANESCMPAGPETGYVQRGDDILMIECPAMDGAVCTCHEPPAENGTCRSFECNADGSSKVEEVKPPPAAQEEKAASPPKAETPKPAAKKKKSRPVAAPASEVEKPAPPVVEEKKVEATPIPEETKPAPAQTGEKKIEYTR
jgi:outer membrane biosynthesis protein TonB